MGCYSNITDIDFRNRWQTSYH